MIHSDNFILFYSFEDHPTVYIMIQCTEPATPAVIACCELPVSLQEAVLDLKTPVSDNCPIREGRGLLLAVVSRVVPTLWKRADQKKKDRRKQYLDSQPCRHDSLTGQ